MDTTASTYLCPSIKTIVLRGVWVGMVKYTFDVVRERQRNENLKANGRITAPRTDFGSGNEPASPQEGGVMLERLRHQAAASGTGAIEVTAEQLNYIHYAHQATIADLQGQIADSEKAYQEKAKLWIEQTGAVSALQQRVAELEQERDALKRDQFAAHACAKTFEQMSDEASLKRLLSALQADHARVLELVQEREYEIKRRIWAMHGSRMGHQLYGDDGRLDCNTCFRKYSDESLETVYGFELYDANVLCAKAASLPAQAAQGGA